jgi:hypothetical protein
MKAGRILICASLAVLLSFAGGLLAEEETIYMHCEDGFLEIENPICTMWHEIYPHFCCGPWHLSSWEDNGNGVLDSCDWIDMTYVPTGDIFWYHVEEVTITIEIAPLGDVLYQRFLDHLGMPALGDPLSSPVCTWWHEIYPDFCAGPFHLTGWRDNGDSVLSRCDTVFFDDTTEPWHVEDVATDIVVTGPTGPSSLEGSTWGRVKSLYR